MDEVRCSWGLALSEGWRCTSDSPYRSRQHSEDIVCETILQVERRNSRIICPWMTGFQLLAESTCVNDAVRFIIPFPQCDWRLWMHGVQEGLEHSILHSLRAEIRYPLFVLSTVWVPSPDGAPECHDACRARPLKSLLTAVLPRNRILSGCWFFLFSGIAAGLKRRNRSSPERGLFDPLPPRLYTVPGWCKLVPLA